MRSGHRAGGLSAPRRLRANVGPVRSNSVSANHQIVVRPRAQAAGTPGSLPGLLKNMQRKDEMLVHAPYILAQASSNNGARIYLRGSRGGDLTVNSGKRDESRIGA